MSYLGLDPAGPFEKCLVCGEDCDYTKSYDHRECVPKVQVIGWYMCLTCRRSPWDCSCPQKAECVECELSVEDIDGPCCTESPDGVHRWRVTDGDSWNNLFGDRAGMAHRTGNSAVSDETDAQSLTPSDLPY